MLLIDAQLKNYQEHIDVTSLPSHPASDSIHPQVGGDWGFEPEAPPVCLILFDWKSNHRLNHLKQVFQSFLSSGIVLPATSKALLWGGFIPLSGMNQGFQSSLWAMWHTPAPCISIETVWWGVGQQYSRWIPWRSRCISLLLVQVFDDLVPISKGLHFQILVICWWIFWCWHVFFSPRLVKFSHIL